MLTLEKLKAMKPNTFFADGLGLIEHPWFNQAKKSIDGGNLAEDGRSTMVRWVAIRGGIHDWAIYHSLDANIDKSDYLSGLKHIFVSLELIGRAGSKLRDEKKIREFVPCNDEAFKMYRF